MLLTIKLMIYLNRNNFFLSLEKFYHEAMKGVFCLVCVGISGKNLEEQPLGEIQCCSFFSISP